MDLWFEIVITTLLFLILVAIIMYGDRGDNTLIDKNINSILYELRTIKKRNKHI